MNMTVVKYGGGFKQLELEGFAKDSVYLGRCPRQYKPCIHVNNVLLLKNETNIF